MGLSRTRSSSAIIAVALVPQRALAHAGRTLEPHDVWGAWTFPPIVTLALAFAACCYLVGLRRVRARARNPRGLAPWRRRSFAAGILALALALMSPIDAVSEALFSVHMVQHLLLITVAAPLLLLGEPAYVMLWALPLGARRTVAGVWRSRSAPRVALNFARRPAIAWTLHMGMLWLWHLPSLYDAALRSPRIHIAEHCAFLGSALLFWSVSLNTRRNRIGGIIAYFFTAALQGTLLGALLTLARWPWYVSHYGTTQPWGLSPLEDQQFAGLLMWVPGGLAYLIAMAVPLLRALRAGPVVLDERVRATALPVNAAVRN